MKTRIDRIDKRILNGLDAAVTVDFERLARLVGCRPEVARDHYQRLVEAGVVQGFRTAVGRDHLPAHELLVVGVPTEQTTAAAISEVSADPAVARFFTMAAHASMAFILRSDDLNDLRRHADALATRAGLKDHRGILVVKTVHEDPHAGAFWNRVYDEATTPV